MLLAVIFMTVKRYLCRNLIFNFLPVLNVHIRICLKSLDFFLNFKDPVLLVSVFILRFHFQNNMVCGNKKLKKNRILGLEYIIYVPLKETLPS